MECVNVVCVVVVMVVVGIGGKDPNGDKDPNLIFGLVPLRARAVPNRRQLRLAVVAFDLWRAESWNNRWR